MTAKKIEGWTFYGYGREEQSFLPERGFHDIVGPYDDANVAVAAHLAVSVAAGDVGCGLAEPDKDGVRSTLGGFFGKPIGAPGGVAIFTLRPKIMARAVAAAALARGVTAPLPIIISKQAGSTMARALAEGEFRLAALRDAMGDNLHLVIIDGLHASTRARADAVHGLKALESFLACPVFVLATEPLRISSAHDSSTLEVGNDAVTFQPPAGADGWSRAFILDRVRLLDGEAVAVRPGEAREFVAKKTKQAAKAPVHVESLKEPKVACRIVYAWTNAPIAAADRVAWADYDGFVQSIPAAVAIVRGVEGDGLVEITIVASHRGGDVRQEARRFETALSMAKLSGRARIVLSDRRLVDPYVAAA